MGSRREEERNEKIIRGLMKLPPNRKCINCNSLGPQYVCTNFWTFVCMTCSGIHREFTHRVKSVSMAKFTSQEVEALQNGGNQRAREAYLNDWDTQRQRLPDSSNADKVRQFIKQVYVEKKYAGGKNSDKPPKDVQGIGNQEDGTRRASSYHSYSQSPPYDSQYEERRYGKQNAGLTRKPGSDRGPYEGKMSSIIYSPGRLSENACDDTFANEGSGARFSDYSASSGGDPFRSDAISPNFQKDVGFSSLKPSVSSGSLDRQISNRSLEANFRRDTEGIPRPQRTASSGSFGSSGSNSVSLTSFNSRSFASPVSEPEHVSATRQDKTSTIAQSTLSGNMGIDLFQAPFRSESASSSSVDLFQAPQTFSTGSNDLIHPFLSRPSSSPIQHQTTPAATSLVDFFADFPQQPTDATLEKRSSEPSSSSKNEGWAAFGSPQLAASVPASENQSFVNASYGGAGSVEKLDLFSSFDSNIKWPIPQNSDWQEHSPSVSDPWIGNINNLEAPPVTSNTQTWIAFGEATKVAPLEGTKHNVEPLEKPSQPENPAQHLGFEAAQDLNIYGFPRPNAGPPSYKMPSNDNLAAPHASAVPPMGDASVHMSGIGYKSSNPFDIPYDNDVEYNNMFLGMSSLQSTLPADAQMPLTFTVGPTHSWFPHNPVGVYPPVASQGGLAYMGGQTATTIPNVSAQGPVASIGGNPFA